MAIKLADAKARTIAKRKELERQREEIVAASTQMQLKTVDKELWEIGQQQVAIDAQIGQACRESEPTSEEKSLKGQLQDKQRLERSLLSDSPLALQEQFVRADAIEHFSAEVKNKAKEADAAMKPLRGKSTVSASGHILKLNEEARTMEAEWQSKTLPACQLGEKIFALREEQKALQARLDELQKARHERAAAKATYHE